MKIKSCNIVSFGKFKNYKIDFSDGFNLIYGDNEAGKSTVMSFIKMMFYGNGGRVSDIDKNLRKKYMPWDSSFMAGSIEFSCGDKNYKLDREFKGSNATDKITLTDMDLKTEVKLGSKGDIGSEIFGLSEAAFEKSVFIGGLGAPEKNAAAEGEINSKLANLTSTGDEDISLELVSSKIKKAKESYMSKSGRIGIYDKDSARLGALEDELRKARETETLALEIEEQIKLKEAESKKVSELSNHSFAVMKKAELVKKKTNLEKYVSASKTVELATKELTLPNGKTADKEYINAINSAKQSLDALQKSLAEKETEESRLTEEAQALRQTSDDSVIDILKDKKQKLTSEISVLETETDNTRRQLSEMQLKATERNKKKSNTPLLITGIVIAVLSVVAAFVSYSFANNTFSPVIYAGLGIAVIGITIFVLSFVSKKSAKNGGLQNDIIEIQKNLDRLLSDVATKKNEISDIDSAINSIIIEKTSNKALFEAKEKEILLKKQSVLTIKSEILDAKSALQALCEPFGSPDDAVAIVERIEKLLSDITAAELLLNLAADGTNCQSREEAEKRLSDLENDETLKGITQEEIASAKDDFKRYTELSGKLREELATMKSRLKVTLSEGKSVPVLEIEKADLKEKLSAEKAFCDAADIAIETLNDSFAAMRQSFGGILESKTSKIFEGLTDGAYSSVDISKDLDIKVNKKDVFGARDWQFLSSGTTDQAYLSLRLALTTLIEDEKDTLPVVMDDALAQYDNARTSAALKYLVDFSKEHQLLLFTCHSDIKNSAEKLGVNLINM